MRFKPRTERQRAATARNWRIRHLRALHALAHILTGERLSIVQSEIDKELEIAGAETTEKRIERLIRERKE